MFLEKRVGEVSRGMFWASASGKALEKSVWGQGLGRDFRNSLFGKAYRGNLPGMLLGPRFKKSHRKSVLERDSRDLLKKSISESVWVTPFGEDYRKGIERTVLGAFSGKTFRKMF